MIDIVSKTIEKYHMIDKEESVLCCLSGGADSTALLLCLLELGYNVRACHINHCLRGAESDSDEKFCVQLCERLGVPLGVRRLDVKRYCAKKGVSIEEGARELRYSVFEEFGCDKVATAHTISDCIETSLFNFARGTGLAGLASIPPVRSNIIRPLIECSRTDIENFLNERGQTWVTDSSNLTDDYSRNRIRHKIVPQMLEINPSLERTMRGTLENLREDNDLLRRLADELYRKVLCDNALECSALLAADRALSGRVIRKFVGANGIECSRETAERILKLCDTGGKLTLGHERYAIVRRGWLLIARIKSGQNDIEISTELGKTYVFFDKNICINIEDTENIQKKLTNYAADYGKIKDVIYLRNKRPGDKIRLAGRGFTSQVKKLLQERFVPEKRNSAVILADKEGVIFVEGYGFAERVKADKNTKTVLFCKISHNCHK